ncbi:MAG: ABC transporter substrate-binding protein, partial [Pseudomonadota bacterium]
MFLKSLLGAASALVLATGPSLAGEITIGTAPNLQTLPIVVAMHEGYFAEEGIELETVKFTSGRRALEALIGGQLDVAFMAAPSKDFRNIVSLSLIGFQ